VNRIPAVLALCCASAGATADSLQTTQVPIHVGDARVVRRVVSFQELRQSKLVRQTWDSSCGAAALSTVLTYQFGMSVSEYAVAAVILRGSDPTRVRARGGFSLLDLKRFVEFIGLEGAGYGAMTLADLTSSAEPAIVPIRTHDLDHFVVFRGLRGDRIVLGDPAYGNLTVTRAQFEQFWKSRIAFYVRARGAQPTQGSQLAATELDLFVPDLGYISRLVRGEGPVPPMRQQPLALR
jgi:uncharacterized protein